MFLLCTVCWLGPRKFFTAILDKVVQYFCHTQERVYSYLGIKIRHMFINFNQIYLN